MSTNSLMNLAFEDSLVRVRVDENGNPWFCAKDVCRVLEIENNRDALSSLDEDEKITVANADSNPRDGIPHSLAFVSESGLYALVFRSRKPEAKRLRKWVTAEVLPSLRKTGAYALPGRARALDQYGLNPLARRLHVRVKAQLMGNATAIAKEQCRTHELIGIYAELCNAVAEGSAPEQTLPGRRFAGGFEESLRAFADECLVAAPEAPPLCDEDVHAAHLRWCAARGHMPLKRLPLVEGLALILPGVSLARPGRRKGSKRPRPAFLRGVALKLCA
jgi:prophage antirepressor-like protein